MVSVKFKNDNLIVKIIDFDLVIAKNLGKNDNY